MEKKARKPSSDLVQEKLRVHKSQWNGNVSALIGELIALKRGLNGKGDPKHNIPPSSIKDPLPNEVLHTLSEVANHYSDVLNDAKSVINEQSQYSARRRKPKQAMEVEASWAGSRMWAKMTHWLKLDKEIRKLRFRILDDAADLKRKFKHLHLTLVGRDGSAVPNGLLIVEQITNQFLHLLTNIKRLQKLVEKNNEEMPGVVAPPTPEVPELPSPIPALQEEVKPPKSNIQSPYRKEILPEESEQLSSNGLDFADLEKINFLTGDLSNAEVVIKYLATLEIPANVHTDILRELNELQNSLILLHQMVKEPLKDKLEEIKILYNQSTVLYQSLLDWSIGFLGAGKSFGDLVSQVPKKESSTDYINLNKIAQKALKRWLGTEWMRINPDYKERLILDLINSMQGVADKLDHFMDMLEDASSDQDALKTQIQSVAQEMSEMLDSALYLGKSYLDPHLLESNVDGVRVAKINQIISRLTRAKAAIENGLGNL